MTYVYRLSSDHQIPLNNDMRQHAIEMLCAANVINTVNPLLNRIRKRDYLEMIFLRKKEENRKIINMNTRKNMQDICLKMLQTTTDITAQLY